MALFSRDKDAPTSEGARWRQVLESALRVSSIASSATPLPDALNAMVREAIGLLRAETGSIMLREEGGQNLVLVAAVGLPPDVYVGDRLPLGESVAGRVLATGKPLLLGDVDQDAFVNFVPKSRPIRSSVVVPLPVQGRPIGVLNLGISAEAPPFTEEDLRIAQMFAEQAGNVIHMTRLHEQSEQRSSDLLALVESSKGSDRWARSPREDLLYVAGIESREASLRIESVDIPTLVRSVAEDVTSEHPDRNVHVDIPPDQKWLCDETKLGLVLRHLIENALKYSDSPHPVVVRAREDDSEL
jgi:GAF domain-containing protein